MRGETEGEREREKHNGTKAILHYEGNEYFNFKHIDSTYLLIVMDDHKSPNTLSLTCNADTTKQTHV